MAVLACTTCDRPLTGREPRRWTWCSDACRRTGTQQGTRRERRDQLQEQRPHGRTSLPDRYADSRRRAVDHLQRVPR